MTAEQVKQEMFRRSRGLYDQTTKRMSEVSKPTEKAAMLAQEKSLRATIIAGIAQELHYGNGVSINAVERAIELIGIKPKYPEYSRLTIIPKSMRQTLAPRLTRP